MRHIALLVVAAVLTGAVFGCAAESPQPENAASDAGSLEIVVGHEKAVFRKISPKKYDIDYPEFYLLETEVTNRLYREYLRATGKRKDDSDVLAILKKREPKFTVTETPKGPVDDDGFQDLGVGGTMSSLEMTSGGPLYSINEENAIWRKNDYPPRLDDYPVAMLTLADATAFCVWLSKTHPDRGLFRLPTWNEWMIAAYGKSRRYPWGNKWDRELAHTSYGYSHDEAKTRAEPVKVRPKGRTPEGLYGMLGNVSEYTIEGDSTSEEYFHLGARWMGGGFGDGKTFGAATEKLPPRQDYWGYSHSTVSRMDGLGFRVLLDVRKDLSLVTRPRLFPQKNNAWRTKSE